MPTVLVIDQNRVVRFVSISPDWLVRAEADEVINALNAISAASKAA